MIYKVLWNMTCMTYYQHLQHWDSSQILTQRIANISPVQAHPNLAKISQILPFMFTNAPDQTTLQV